MPTRLELRGSPGAGPRDVRPGACAFHQPCQVLTRCRTESRLPVVNMSFLATVLCRGSLPYLGLLRNHADLLHAGSQPVFHQPL